MWTCHSSASLSFQASPIIPNIPVSSQALYTRPRLVISDIVGLVTKSHLSAIRCPKLASDWSNCSVSQGLSAQCRLVISDIDGTITKSDLLGHLLPRVGFDWSHRGVTRLFTNIKANGYIFMFLSSRAIAQASATRDYLHTLNQDGETLPAGPVIISPDGLFPSLYRELVSLPLNPDYIKCKMCTR